MLHVADGYGGCLKCVSTAEFVYYTNIYALQI